MIISIFEQNFDFQEVVPFEFGEILILIKTDRMQVNRSAAEKFLLF